MKKYYKYLDLVRVFCCIAILFYHLDLLKGGYLAVCTFFVLSGYLNVLSGFRKEKFSLKDYYISRFKKLYIPLLLVVFLSVAFITAFTNFNWVNLKPEVTSILFGYNNFWQLNANLDYFVRNVSSPFMHLWYISLLLQFELIFPLLFIGLKKLKEKVHRIVPMLLLLICGIASGVFFYLEIKNGHIMNAYYGTFARIFSLFFGMLIGFFQVDHKPLVLKTRDARELFFYVYLLVLLVLFFIVDSKSFLFSTAMILTTLISMRLIDYAVCNTEKQSPFEKILEKVASFSYEIYLVQYPVIFFFKDMNLFIVFKVLLIILITFVISYIIHFSLDIKKKDKLKVFKLSVLTLLVLMSLVGVFQYVVAKNYTKDMKKLETDLNKNKKLIEKKQKEYLEKQKEEQQQWEDFLNKNESDEKDVETMVHNLKVVGIGDSIMELCIKELYEEFPNGYFDAATNRTEHAVPGIIRDLKSKGIVPDVYLFNVGTNGWCDDKCHDAIMAEVGDTRLFWVNATSPDYEAFNPALEEFASQHSNVDIIDWRSYGLAHQEYLIYDKVHPNVRGLSVYAHKLYEGMYEYYLKEYQEKRNQMIQEHDKQIKNRITFIGNDLLTSIYDLLDENYQNKNFIADDYNFESLKKELKEENLTNTLVFVFDETFELDEKKVKEFVELCGDKDITFIHMSSTKLEVDGVKIINFNPKDYTTFDKIHLTDDGRRKLVSIIQKNIKE